MNQPDIVGEIPENRPLSTDERRLTEWLLRNGSGSGASYLEQLAAARVVSRCGCGCASINFSVGDGGWHSRGSEIEIVSDYHWSDAAGRKFGIFVFAKRRMLAGFEVWSIDGHAMPTSLPAISELKQA